MCDEEEIFTKGDIDKLHLMAKSMAKSVVNSFFDKLRKDVEILRKTETDTEILNLLLKKL